MTLHGGRVPAGWLIEKAGMKGASVRGCGSKSSAPNYIVNNGGATSRDVRELAVQIKSAVKEKIGVEME